MTRRLVLVSILLLLAGLVLLGLGMVDCRIRRGSDVGAIDLLVDASVLPPGWSVRGGPISARDDPHILEHEDARDYASVGFGPPDARFPNEVTASHAVWDFGNNAYAAIEFYTRFRPDAPTIQGALPGWSYRSEVADRFRSYVRSVMGISVFYAVGQYGPLISAFSAPISSANGMSTQALERILGAIDERMADCLGKATPSVWPGTPAPLGRQVDYHTVASLIS